MASTGTGGDGGDLDAKRAEMTRTLEGREQERQAERQAKRAVQQDEAAPEESVEGFWVQFNEVKAALEERLGGKAVEPLADWYDGMAAQVRQLQKLASASTHFLPAYDVRQAQSQSKDLHGRVADARAKGMPKKKFSFSSRRKKEASGPAAAPVPAAAASEASSSSRLAELLKAKDIVTIANLKGETIVKRAGSMAGLDCDIRNLEDCTVYLCDSMTSLRIDGLRRCRIYAGPVSGPVYVDNADECTFMLAAVQARIHICTGCDFYLHIRTIPIIEDCSRVRTAPYAFAVDGKEALFSAAGLELDVNNWDNIKDFKWLHLDRPSPNWAVLPEAERVAPVVAPGDEQSR